MNYEAFYKGALNKVAARRRMATEDLGDGLQLEYPEGDKESLEYIKKVKELSKPMSFGEASLDAAPMMLLAAAIGGIGSAALSGGDVGAGLAGAAGSGALTWLANAIPNTGKRKMSVADALAEASNA